MARPSVHALPALLVAVASLALPFLGGDDAAVGTAGSVTARAAQVEGQTGGDQRWPTGSPTLEAARSAAVAYWGGTEPCNGQYELVWTQLDAGTNATASWRNPSDAWNNAPDNFDCRIDMNPQAEYDVAKLCTVLAHEIGHLLGQQHDPAAGRLMSAYYSTALPECEHVATASGEPVAATRDEVEEDVAFDDAVLASDATRRTLQRTTARKAVKRKVRKCVVRKRHGKRVRVCFKVTVKARKAARTSRKG